jgi:hypothetical protein
MIRNHLLAFDDFISSTATVYTTDELAVPLGHHNRLAIHCVVDHQNNAGGIRVQVQHSGDGRNWLPKYAGNGEISTPNNIPANSIASLGGFDQGDTPSFRFVRLAIRLVSPCTNARVRITVTGHDRG